MKKGDNNVGFFHRFVNKRHNKKFIGELGSEKGERLIECKAVLEEVLNVLEDCSLGHQGFVEIRRTRWDTFNLGECKKFGESDY